MQGVCVCVCLGHGSGAEREARKAVEGHRKTGKHGWGVKQGNGGNMGECGRVASASGEEEGGEEGTAGSFCFSSIDQQAGARNRGVQGVAGRRGPGRSEGAAAGAPLPGEWGRGEWARMGGHGWKGKPDASMRYGGAGIDAMRARRAGEKVQGHARTAGRSARPVGGEAWQHLCCNQIRGGGGGGRGEGWAGGGATRWVVVGAHREGAGGTAVGG